MSPFRLALFLAAFLFSTVCPANPNAALTQTVQDSISVSGDVNNDSVSTGFPQIGTPAKGQVSEGIKVIESTPRSENTGTQPVQDVRSPWKPDQFQSFVEAATGKRLEHYGHDLFKQSTLAFPPLQDTPVPSDYVIGPGDELLVRLTGTVELDVRVTADRNGLIHLSRIGAISVVGVRVAELEGYLRSKIAKLYKNFSISASLGQLRSMQIYVMGQARKPGAYVVSSLSTLVSAIFASGGPSATGSLRHIKLIRKDQQLAEIDLYALLGQGIKANDTRLQPGDVIVIPPAGPRVALLGAYNNPAIYELRGDGETIDQVMAYGGGMSVTTLPQLAMLERISVNSGGKRAVEQINLSRDRDRFLLMNGDVLTLMPISMQIGNAVTLRGHVATPFRYPHWSNMRVRDLFPDLAELQNSEYFKAKNDLINFEQGYLQPAPTEGASAMPKLKQLVATTVNWDYATIERINQQTLRQELIPFNLREAIFKGDPAHNLVLMPGDVVTVYSTQDVGVPGAKETRMVRLEGEVAVPGVYQVGYGETLRELVVRIGGVTPDAYLFGSQFFRESVKQEQQRRWEENLNQLAAKVELTASNNAQDSFDTADLGATSISLDGQRKLVERLRKIKPEGRIALEILPGDGKVADIPAVVLENGDHFIVPRMPPYVTVLGQVNNPGSFFYRTDKQVSDFLGLAGGPTKNASVSDLFVVHANGTVSNASGGSWLDFGMSADDVQPGDTVVVPEKLERFSWRRELKDWTSILYQFGLGAAGLKSLGY